MCSIISHYLKGQIYVEKKSSHWGVMGWVTFCRFSTLKSTVFPIKWAQGEAFPLLYDINSMCVTAITSGGVSDAQGEWQTRKKCRIQA